MRRYTASPSGKVSCCLRGAVSGDTLEFKRIDSMCSFGNKTSENVRERERERVEEAVGGEGQMTLMKRCPVEGVTG